ncbi:MAG: TIM barrel protein [Alphaproteobacteria bacterium]|jgi:hydroxypyruvate isomerase|nr:TIM barrel protein [Alphaproteobacteria bacterium]MBT4967236.1 TIM barrel protein [Alphaproteobacteria bacterium]MBT5160833.1 TIM barrel protein [Alphaproteobacteria bacterium]MBT5917550.1 TIM barrel protein [Alphaproteobacteria bacterium]
MKFSINISTMFQELDILDRFQAVKDAGFDAVEIQFPHTTPVADIALAAEAAGVEVVLFNVPPGDFAAGERGLAALPGREQDFRSAIKTACDYARVLKPIGINVLAGIPGPDADKDACWKTLVANLNYAASEFEAVGTKALVEPLNDRDVQGFFIPTSELVVQAITQAGHKNLALQYDFYHARMMETDPVAELERWYDHIAHMQFADNGGRHEPGTGDIDWQGVFTTIHKLGYTGWVGAEYIPSGATTDSLDWLPTFSDWAGINS